MASAVLPEATVAIDTMWVLVCGFLVFFMNAGFGCVEAGFCRAKNATNILAKNFVVFGIASLAFWAVGFGLMFGDGGALFGTHGWLSMGADNSPATGDAYSGVFSALSWAGVPFYAKFFFQLVFAGTAATIVSGCVAERIHYGSFMLFSVVIAGLLYPITGHWIWGGGWLQKLGMWDFAGSTVVHSVGGWAGLAGILLLGPRIGKYRKDGSISPIPGHSMALAFVGAMILWLGWFGFNPGSTMAISGNSVNSVVHIVLTTNLACSAGMLAATIISQLLTGKPDFGMTVNGALAGLVAVTAGCAFVSLPSSVLIGVIGGILVVLAVRFFDRLRIDDPVGALSVHLVCGIWGTLAVGLFADTAAPGGIAESGLFAGGGLSLLGKQALGVVSVGAFTLVASLAVWALIKAFLGIRVAAVAEAEGLDIHEMGGTAYPHEPAIDVVDLIRKSSLGRHESEIIGAEMVRKPRAASKPPGGPAYLINLRNVDSGLFKEEWIKRCRDGGSGFGKYESLYSHFTTFHQNGGLRFRGGDPTEVRRQLESLARTINPDAVAMLERERFAA